MKAEMRKEEDTGGAGVPGHIDNLRAMGYSIFSPSAAAPAKDPTPTPAEPTPAPATTDDADQRAHGSAGADAPASKGLTEELALAADAHAGSDAANTPAPVNKYRQYEQQQAAGLQPSPLLVPEEVVKQLLTALKNNDTPAPNAGLKTVLRFSSPSNPITQREPDFFFGMMQNSQYSLLLGKFDTFTVVSTEGMPNNYGSGETVVVEVTLLGSTQAMIDAGVDFNYMDSTGGQDRSAVSLKWQLSKDPETECWLSDTLFFVPVSQKSKTMQQLNQDVSESTKFVGTLALHMWGAHVALLRTLHRQMVCQEYANAHAHGRVCVCALARAHTHRHRQAGHARTHTHTHTHTHLDVQCIDTQICTHERVTWRKKLTWKACLWQTGTSASQKLKAQAPKSVKVQPSALAKAAVQVGMLRPTSPLVTTPMVGNKGFDPAGFASSPDLLLQYREAELKHCRLAMLAAAGWVAAEVLHTPIANLLGKESLLVEGANSVAEKVPSVLNGGLEGVPPMFWVSFGLLVGAVEAWRMLEISENPMNFTPGAVGFDPLGMYAEADAKGQRELQLKEINNGRLAMMAVAWFAVAEKFGDSAVINSIPFLPKTGNLLEDVADAAEDIIESLWL